MATFITDVISLSDTVEELLDPSMCRAQDIMKAHKQLVLLYQYLDARVTMREIL